MLHSVPGCDVATESSFRAYSNSLNCMCSLGSLAHRYVSMVHIVAVGSQMFFQLLVNGHNKVVADLSLLDALQVAAR